MRIVTSVALVILFLASSLPGHAQKKKAAKDSETKPIEPTAQVSPQQAKPTRVDSVFDHYFTKYLMASRWNDNQIARSTLYDMIILKPENDSLVFALAYAYFETRQYAPSMLISQDLLKQDSKNLSYLELSAASFESLGILDRSLQNYETMFLLSNNPMALYKIVFLQYDLKRYEEGLTNIDILLAKPEAESIKIGYNDTANQPKDFPMKYPLLNLKAMILNEKGDKAGAKKMLEDIIKQAPDFQPAVESLGNLNKK